MGPRPSLRPLRWVGEWAELLPLFTSQYDPVLSKGNSKWLVCLFLCRSGQVTSAPLKTQPNVHPNYSSQAAEMTNDVQRDQSAPPLQPDKTLHSLPQAPSNTPTDPPFISFPVTKTPGTSRRSMWCRTTDPNTSLSCRSYLAGQISGDLGSQGPAGRGLIALGTPKQCQEQLGRSRL